MEQTLLDALREAAERIPVLNTQRQYWFIRTNGGAFYQDFWESRSVGIGYNLITLAEVNRALANSEKRAPHLTLIDLVKERYPKVDPPGRAVGLIMRFLTEMKPGDVVVIPSGSSFRLAFGEITDAPPSEIVTNTTNDNLIYRKRRSVKWLTQRDWYSLDSNLYSAFSGSQALIKITPYEQYLDREMYSIYSKGGETHVRLDIGTPGGIDGEDYFDMGHSLLALCRDFKSEAGLTERGNKIEVRSNVQSPGLFEFITHAPVVATFLASALIVGLFGGHLKAEKLGIDIGTRGLFKNISDFLMEGKKRQLLEELRKNLSAMDANMAADVVLRLSGASPSVPSTPPVPQSSSNLPQSPPTTPRAASANEA